MAPFAHLAAILALTPAALAKKTQSHHKVARQQQGTFDDTNWQKYIRSPSTSNVKPKAIISANTTGDISNPNGLLDGSATTVFTRNGDSDPVPSLIVDFGQNVVGTLSIDFAGSTNATSSYPGLKLAFSESMQHLSDRSDFTRSDNGDASSNTNITPGTDQVQVTNGAFTWKDSFGCLNEGNVCSDGLHGFRYVKISLDAYDGDAPDVASTGVVQINQVSLDWVGYLGTADTFTGWFDSSDTGLTQLWYDGVYTVDMGTAEFTTNQVDPRGAASSTLEGKQVLFDGAKRDRDPYVGDMTVASKTSYLSHNFSQSSVNVLADLADHQRDDGWIPPASIFTYGLTLFDYPLHWVVSSVDYVLYTGDTAYIQKYWTNLQNVLDKFYLSTINSNGLVEKSSSSQYNGDYAFIPRTGPITYYNALYIYALRYAAKLADQTGQSADAASWNTRADSISAALLQYNMDASVGAFFDGGPCPNADPSTVCQTHAQDGNAIAVLANVTSTDQATTLLNYYASAAGHDYGNAFYDNDNLSGGYSQRVYAFISYFEIAARLVTPGQTSSALDQIRRMYGWFEARDPQCTFWESIGTNGDPQDGNTSLSHGWSTGVVSHLSNYILGVTPTAPGFSSWTVNPVIQDTGLTWAKGVVPTPNGSIGVSWTTDNNVLAIEIEAPQGSNGLVYVPTSGFDSWSVSLNGEDISKNGNVIPH